MVCREILVTLPAIALFLSACGQTPDQVNNSGNESYMNSDYAAALDAYEGARERVPMSGELHYNVGNAMYRIEEFEDSLKEFDEALLYAMGELRSRALFNRGNAAFRTREYAQAGRGIQRGASDESRSPRREAQPGTCPEATATTGPRR